jgi:chemotaxis protein MotB
MARRRPEREDNDSHDRWLVSYADFITLLFAFFVVMYAISQLNEGKYRLLSEALTQAFKPDGAQPDRRPPAPQGAAPGEVGGRGPDGQADAGMQAIARDLINALDPLVKGGQVRVTESGLGISVEINASVLFASGEAELQPSALSVLASVANVLAPLPNDVEVEGHTDNAPIATPRFPSNWELSTARASSVVRLFIDQGVAPVRLAAVGYADTRNISPNTTPEGRAQNRRVTIMILPEKKRNNASAPATPPMPPGESAGPAAGGAAPGQ